MESSSSSRNKVLVQPTWNHFACRKAASAAKQGSRGSSCSSAEPTAVACSVAAGVISLVVAAAATVATAVEAALSVDRTTTTVQSADVVRRSPATKYLTTSIFVRFGRETRRGRRQRKIKGKQVANLMDENSGLASTEQSALWPSLGLGVALCLYRGGQISCCRKQHPHFFGPRLI